MSTPVDTNYTPRADTVYTTEDVHTKGGLQVVANAAARDAIPAARRKSGMVVTLTSDKTSWQLQDDLTTWSPYATGGGGAPPAFIAWTTQTVAQLYTAIQAAVAAGMSVIVDIAGNKTITTGTYNFDRVIWSARLNATLTLNNGVTIDGSGLTTLRAQGPILIKTRGNLGSFDFFALTLSSGASIQKQSGANPIVMNPNGFMEIAFSNGFVTVGPIVTLGDQTQVSLVLAATSSIGQGAFFCDVGNTAFIVGQVDDSSFIGANGFTAYSGTGTYVVNMISESPLPYYMSGSGAVSIDPMANAQPVIVFFPIGDITQLDVVHSSQYQGKKFVLLLKQGSTPFAWPDTANGGTVVLNKDLRANAIDRYECYNDGNKWIIKQIQNIQQLATMPRAEFNPDFSVFSGPVKLIYLRSTGNDSTGDGTLARPYLTIERAKQDIPSIYNGTSYMLEMTNYGTYNLGINPLILGGFLGGLANQAFSTVLSDYTTAGFGIFAAPAIDVTLNFATTTQVSDPDSNLITITDTSQAWAVDQWKGFHWTEASNGGFISIRAVIVSNTATSLLVTTSFSHVGNASYSYRISHPSCVINYTDPNSTFQDAVQIYDGVGEVVLDGIEITGGSTGYSSVVQANSVRQIRFQSCKLGGVFSDTCDITFEGCYLRSPSNSTSASDATTDMFRGDLRFNGCYVRNQNLLTLFSPKFVFAAQDSFFEDCNGLNTFFSNELALSVISVQGCEIKNAKEHGLYVLAGPDIGSGDSGACISHVKINGCNGSAIKSGNDACFSVFHVAGSGNTRYGIENPYGKIKTFGSGTMTVTGNLGDIKVGSKPPRSWTSYFASLPLGAEVDLGVGSWIRDTTTLYTGLDTYPDEAGMVASNTGFITLTVTSRTDGIVFVPTRPGLRLIGAKITKPAGPPSSPVKVTLWDVGTQGGLGNVTQTMPTGAGDFIVLFVVPIALSAGKAYALTKRDPSGFVAWHTTAAQLLTLTDGALDIAHLQGVNGDPGWFRTSGCFAAGDAYPSTVDNATNIYLVTPIFA